MLQDLLKAASGGDKSSSVLEMQAGPVSVLGDSTWQDFVPLKCVVAEIGLT